MKMTIFSRFGHCLASRDITAKHFRWNMAFPVVVKILFTLIVFLFFCGLQVDCKVEKYAFNIVGNGTSFKEEVEVDVDDQTEVIRVPRHNDEDAVEIMNDFIADLSVRRDSARKVCYVSKLDSSFPSPGKMKLDMDQASRQSTALNEVAKSYEWKVVGFADRWTLSQKILKFCGIFPLYEIKIEEIPSDSFNTSLRPVSGHVRRKRHHMRKMQISLCSHSYDYGTLVGCLKKVGHANINYQCKIRPLYRYCHWVTKCIHRGPLPHSYDYECSVYHYYNYPAFCCSPSC